MSCTVCGGRSKHDQDCPVLCANDEKPTLKAFFAEVVSNPVLAVQDLYGGFKGSLGFQLQSSWETQFSVEHSRIMRENFMMMPPWKVLSIFALLVMARLISVPIELMKKALK